MLCICIGLYTHHKDSFKLLFYVIYVVTPVKPDSCWFIFEVWQVSRKKNCLRRVCGISAGIRSKLTDTQYQPILAVSVCNKYPMPILVSANAVFGIAILSVHLSLHHMHALWWNERSYCRYFDTTWKGDHFSILIPTEVGGQHPHPSKIFDCLVVFVSHHKCRF